MRNLVELEAKQIAEDEAKIKADEETLKQTLEIEAQIKAENEASCENGEIVEVVDDFVEKSEDPESSSISLNIGSIRIKD